MYRHDELRMRSREYQFCVMSRVAKNQQNYHLVNASIVRHSNMYTIFYSFSYLSIYVSGQNNCHANIVNVSIYDIRRLCNTVPVYRIAILHLMNNGIGLMPSYSIFSIFPN